MRRNDEAAASCADRVRSHRLAMTVSYFSGLPASTTAVIVGIVFVSAAGLARVLYRRHGGDPERRRAARVRDMEDRPWR